MWPHPYTHLERLDTVQYTPTEYIQFPAVVWAATYADRHLQAARIASFPTGQRIAVYSVNSIATWKDGAPNSFVLAANSHSGYSQAYLLLPRGSDPTRADLLSAPVLSNRFVHRKTGTTSTTTVGTAGWSISFPAPALIPEDTELWFTEAFWSNTAMADLASREYSFLTKFLLIPPTAALPPLFSHAESRNGAVYP